MANQLSLLVIERSVRIVTLFGMKMNLKRLLLAAVGALCWTVFIVNYSEIFATIYETGRDFGRSLVSLFMS